MTTPTAFSALGLSPPLIQAIAERGYTDPTPVQLAAIPAALRREDIWAEAQTGSGKTAAFALPILQRLSRRPIRTPRPIGALVLVPTRELAAQVGASLETYGAHLEPALRVRTVFGGVSINPQMMALRGGADVLVATPGRLLDLHAKNALALDTIDILVLDEADRLLERGFADELNGIFERLPARRQTLLFSATFPPAVQALAERVLREPTRVEVATTPDTAPAITQRIIEVDRAQRGPLLRHLIAEHAPSRALVFVATTYATEHVAEKLTKAGITAAALHGKLSQGARTRALARFRDGGLDSPSRPGAEDEPRLQVLVATDLAARGLDIAALPWVVNYDLPRSPDDYLHRIGRTARAGESGVAVTFVTADTHAHFRVIERRHRLRLPRERIAGFEPTEAPPPPTKGQGGVKGKRKSKKDKLREAAARGE